MKVSPVTTRAALLQALRNGPGYGRELIRRAARISAGQLRLSPGRVYPALESLAAEGLLRVSEVTPGGARGARSRTYYELTPRGVAVSGEHRQVLEALVQPGPPQPLDAAERRRMAERLRQASDLSAAVMELQRALTRAIKRRSR
jgi:DNA-binding PadR family transcriptional regulator